MGDFFDAPEAPPPPDYSDLAKASKQSARWAYELSRKQQRWARKTYRDNKAIAKIVIGKGLERMDEFDANAREDRQRYEDVYQPVEDAFVEDAMTYNSPEDIAARKAQYAIDAEEAADRATTEQTIQMRQARAAAADRLEAFGIDPSQTRAGALDKAFAVAEATGRAGAAYLAREGEEAEYNQNERYHDTVERALKSEVINIGRGYPGQVAAGANIAAANGSGASGTGLATTASGASTMGTGMGWNGQAQSGYGMAGNLMNQGYDNELDAARFNATQSSGAMQLLGFGAGMAYKTYGGPGWTFAEGGAVPDEEVMASLPPPAYGVPVDTAADPYHDGVPISNDMSPSQGVEVDDVDARVNAGEFIIPADVVSWRGESYYQKEIQKARQEKEQGTVAKPSLGPALPVG